ncbi:hypothetical protein D9M68_152000 [compost metagenome]
MEEVTKAIQTRSRRAPEGALLTAKEFAASGNRAAADKALSRLAKTGELTRVYRGMYTRPRKTPYGNVLPEAEAVVKSYAMLSGEKIVNSGAAAANMLGLTTQVPVQKVFLTSGKSKNLTLGRRTIRLKHAPAWVTALPKTKAGEALRAIAHLGRKEALQHARLLKSKLTPEEWAKVLALKSKVPTWITAVILKAENER